jgi:hypothetical protein
MSIILKCGFINAYINPKIFKSLKNINNNANKINKSIHSFFDGDCIYFPFPLCVTHFEINVDKMIVIEMLAN